MLQHLKLVSLSMLCLLFAACPGRFTRPEQSVTADEALAALKARGEAIQTVNAMASLEAWREDDRVKFRQFLLMQRPDKLRVDTLSPFDQPLVITTSDGQTVSVYSLEKKQFLQGPATPQNLARLLNLKMDGEELVALVGGGVPLVTPVRKSITWDADEGRWRLEIEGVRRRQHLELEPERLRVTSTTVWQGDAVQYTVKMGQYGGTPPAEVPQRLRVEVPSEKLRVDITVKDFTLNEEMDPEAFTLTPPGGITVEPL
ncbi:MAG: LolA family protein [Bradymonadia bacterium]